MGRAIGESPLVAHSPGTAACIIGAGATGTEIARRLAAFDVTVTGVRRHPPSGPVSPFVAVYSADRLLDCVAEVDSVIIAAGYQAGQPALVDDTVLLAMRPGAWLVNIARGALLDAEATLALLNTGRLAGIGLDVFPTEPCPADGPLLAHPRIVATAHTASLTSDYFAAASRKLGDALASYLDDQPPSGLLRPRQSNRGLQQGEATALLVMVLQDQLRDVHDVSWGGPRRRTLPRDARSKASRPPVFVTGVENRSRLGCGVFELVCWRAP